MEQLDKLLAEVKAQGEKLAVVAETVAKLKSDLAAASALSDADKATLTALEAEVAKNSTALEALAPTPAAEPAAPATPAQ